MTRTCAPLCQRYHFPSSRLAPVGNRAHQDASQIHAKGLENSQSYSLLVLHQHCNGERSPIVGKPNKSEFEEHVALLKFKTKFIQIVFIPDWDTE